MRVVVNPVSCKADTLEGVAVQDDGLSCQEVKCDQIYWVINMPWAEKEIERMDAERKEKQTGEFTSASRLCPAGKLTQLEVLNEKPEQVDGKFGMSAVFLTRKKDESGEVQDYKMTVKLQSPLYRDIVEKLMGQKEGEYVALQIVRAGDGQQTRYSVA